VLHNQEKIWHKNGAIAFIVFDIHVSQPIPPKRNFKKSVSFSLFFWARQKSFRTASRRLIIAKRQFGICLESIL
jgi:hypothetical protein